MRLRRNINAGGREHLEGQYGLFREEYEELLNHAKKIVDSDY